MKTLIAILIVGQASAQEFPGVAVSADLEHNRPVKLASEVFAEAAITSPSLLRIADSKSFRSAGWARRVERIQRWIRRNAIEHFRELDLKNRDLALIRIAKQLDNLLAEKDFRVPKARTTSAGESDRTSQIKQPIKAS